MKITSFVILLCALSSLIVKINSDVVCDLKTLKTEIEEDINDNGMLDCLRQIDPPHFKEENEDEKNLRLFAQWDSSCSFTTTIDWLPMLGKHYSIHEYCDSNGDPNGGNPQEQADICVIIRAALCKGLFELTNVNFNNLRDLKIPEKIACASPEGDDDGPSICAANAGSYFKSENWNVFLYPSFMQFNGKPAFSQVNRQTELDSKIDDLKLAIKDKITKDVWDTPKAQLENNGGLIARMINGIKGKMKEKMNQSQEADKPSDGSRTHVHVRRIDEINVSDNNQYSLVDESGLGFALNEEKTVFGFYMFTYNLNQPGFLCAKMSFDGRDIHESRQCMGSLKQGAISSGFAYKRPPSDEQAVLKMSYTSTAVGKAQTDGKSSNISYTAITMPPGSVVKHNFMGLDKLLPPTGEMSSLIDDFSLSIENRNQNDRYFLIMYNIAVRIPEDCMFTTFMKLDDNPLESTYTSIGNTQLVGNHAAIVVSLNHGNHSVNLNYQLSEAKRGEKNVIFGHDDPKFNQNQSFTAIELPEDVRVVSKSLDRPLLLYTKGNWKNTNMFDTDFRLNITAESQVVLFLYHINLNIKQTTFDMRLVIGKEKFSRRSFFSMSKLEHIGYQGYLVKMLKRGEYIVDLQYKSTSPSTFQPNGNDKQGIHMQIISFM